MFDDDSAVMIVGADGSGLRVVVDANPGLNFRDGFYADVSPDGSSIVYTSCQYTSEISEYRTREGVIERDYYHYEIGTVAIDGTQVRRLTENENIDHYPTWSPDGRRIAYFSSSSDPSPLLVLQVMSRDGSHIREVGWWHLEQAEGVPDDVDGVDFSSLVPVWSPDGEHVALVVVEYSEEKYDRGEDHGRAVYAIEVDGTEIDRVSEIVSTASWSPDGSRLAFAELRREGVFLVTVASDGSESIEVAKITLGGDRFANRYGSWIDNLSWSPDGAHIMFQCDVGICIVNLESGVVSESPTQEILPARLYVGDGPRIAWPPDGSRIAVRALDFPSAEPGGYPVVYTMDPDGTNVQLLVRSGLAKGPQAPAFGEYESGEAACGNGIVVQRPESNPGLVGDCVTLLSTRDILAREVPLNWSPDVPIDEWEGITIGGEPPRVIGLELLWGVGVGWIHPISRWLIIQGDYKVVPVTGLPKDLANLRRLQTHSLAVNVIEGITSPAFSAYGDWELPLELANLKDLRHLYIKWQHFWGCLPEQFSDVWVDATTLNRCEGESP